jgi:hypothetical protein
MSTAPSLRVVVSIALLLGACQRPAHPAPTSTVAPTRASMSADTASTAWEPGDPIPGWDDYDCAETAGSQAFQTVFPNNYRFSASFPAGATNGPQTLRVAVRDCVAFSCIPDKLALDKPYASVTLDASSGTSTDPRGLGWWGPDATDPRHVEGIGNGPVESWSNSGYGSTSVVTVCMSKVRPDIVAGVIRVEVTTANSAMPLGSLFGSIIYRFPFTIPMADHSGLDTAVGGERPPAPDGFTEAHFVYDRNYATAWPWGDITDATIRDTVYERYRPYNHP